jgi:hypothetical protein
MAHDKSVWVFVCRRCQDVLAEADRRYGLCIECRAREILALSPVPPCLPVYMDAEMDAEQAEDVRIVRGCAPTAVKRPEPADKRSSALLGLFRWFWAMAAGGRW